MCLCVCCRFTFDLPKTKCIVHDGDRQDVRLLLLNQDLDPTGVCAGHIWGVSDATAPAPAAVAVATGGRALLGGVKEQRTWLGMP